MWVFHTFFHDLIFHPLFFLPCDLVISYITQNSLWQHPAKWPILFAFHFGFCVWWKEQSSNRVLVLSYSASSLSCTTNVSFYPLNIGTIMTDLGFNIEWSLIFTMLDSLHRAVVCQWYKWQKQTTKQENRCRSGWHISSGWFVAASKVQWFFLYYTINIL